MHSVFRLLGWLLGTVLSAVLVLIVVDSLHSRRCFDDPKPGTLISVEGERMRILESDVADPEDVLVLDVIREPPANPDYSLVPEHGHFHPKQEERFEIISGRARFLIGDEYVVLSPGDVGIVPANTLHHWMALDGLPVHVRAVFEPSLDVDLWFLHFHERLAAGDMDLLQAAVITREYGDSSPMPASPPPAVWNVLSRILAPVGRLLGYEAC